MNNLYLKIFLSFLALVIVVVLIIIFSNNLFLFKDSQSDPNIARNLSTSDFQVIYPSEDKNLVRGDLIKIVTKIPEDIINNYGGAIGVQVVLEDLVSGKKLDSKVDDIFRLPFVRRDYINIYKSEENVDLIYLTDNRSRISNSDIYKNKYKVTVKFVYNPLYDCVPRSAQPIDGECPRFNRVNKLKNDQVFKRFIDELPPIIINNVSFFDGDYLEGYAVLKENCFRDSDGSCLSNNINDVYFRATGGNLDYLKDTFVDTPSYSQITNFPIDFKIGCLHYDGKIYGGDSSNYNRWSRTVTTEMQTNYKLTPEILASNDGKLIKIKISNLHRPSQTHGGLQTRFSSIKENANLFIDEVCRTGIYVDSIMPSL